MLLNVFQTHILQKEGSFSSEMNYKELEELVWRLSTQNRAVHTYSGILQLSKVARSICSPSQLKLGTITKAHQRWKPKAEMVTSCHSARQLGACLRYPNNTFICSYQPVRMGWLAGWTLIWRFECLKNISDMQDGRTRAHHAWSHVSLKRAWRSSIIRSKNNRNFCSPEKRARHHHHHYYWNLLLNLVLRTALIRTSLSTWFLGQIQQY